MSDCLSLVLRNMRQGRAEARAPIFLGYPSSLRATGPKMPTAPENSRGGWSLLTWSLNTPECLCHKKQTLYDCYPLVLYSKRKSNMFVLLLAFVWCHKASIILYH